ncbi:MAG: hypothetical protein R2718_01335 [Solirubrobacterales bacterium]|nr:hypothetical protein [Solirubrobacterales bacterium]
MIAAVAVAAVLAIAAVAQARSDAEPVSKPVAAKAMQKAEGRRGPRGPAGPPGRPGPQGSRGPEGRRGPAGLDAGPARQFIAIDWQNNRYTGRDVQQFDAPGIGTGEVQCIPPWAPDGGQEGKMRIQFWQSDGVRQRPEKWATTMWVTRFGGNVDDLNRSRRMAVKTNRIRAIDDNRSSFHEDMDTAPIGQYDPESMGSFTGLITTEPFNDTTAEQPPPVSFRLSWYWNFRDQAGARCYVAGSFVTRPQ